MTNLVPLPRLYLDFLSNGILSQAQDMQKTWKCPLRSMPRQGTGHVYGSAISDGSKLGDRC